MTGTAAPSQGWLLVEHPGPWAVDALAGSGIAADVQDALRSAAGSARARILLVRRPGRMPPEVGTPRTWSVRWTDPDRLPADGTWAEDADLLAAADALVRPSGQPPGSLAELEKRTLPVLLVCTHGRHDTCCAVRGRPVAAALAQAFPGRTWECSHVGGDRFAANLVVLPDGTYYGAVDDTSVVDLVQNHLAGRVDARHLRGVVGASPWEQAAIVEMHARRGPLGPRDVSVDPDRPTVSDGPDAWRVHLLVLAPGSDGMSPTRLDASVRRAAAEPQLLTCRATRTSSAPLYEVVLDPPG